MKKKEIESKPEWNAPGYKALKFSQTFNGGIRGAHEGSWTTTVLGDRLHGTAVGQPS